MLHPFELSRRFKHQMLRDGPHEPDCPRTILDLVDGIVTIDPDNRPESPSTSRNNVHFFGCEETVSGEDVDRTIALYSDAGIERFFFWLSPNDQSEQIETLLVERGASKWRGTGYPTLLRKAERLADHPTDLVVSQVSAGEVTSFREDISRIYADPRFRPMFVETCGAPDQHHFLGFDGDRPVSAGILRVYDDLGTLGWMATAEAARGRGGQSALIVARVNLAVKLGCEWVSGSTLYVLESSLRNMQRKGFQIVYDRLVYGFGTKGRIPSL